MKPAGGASTSAYTCAFLAFAWILVPGGLPGSRLASAQSTSVVARAAGVTGHAVLLTGVSAPFPLTAGYILNPGDRIDTHGGGRVVIDLSDGSMVVVAPESIVILKDFRSASSLRELFEITTGMVRVKINHFAGKPNPYRMNSPTASIAVRGTEFSIEVDAQGVTQVVVYEGIVEVTSLSDPNRRVLIEAGRGVLVRPGQDFHLLGTAPGVPGNRDLADHNDAGDHDHQGGAIAAKGPGGAPPPPAGQGQPPVQAQSHDHDEASPRATASTYDRYVAGLADVQQLPFLFRFNAYPEGHLDSLENPAYATGFQQGEGRVFLLPTFSGVRGLQEYQSAFGPGGSLPGNYSVSPQISMFTPLGAGGFTLGGSVSASRVGDASLSSQPDTDPSLFGSSSSVNRTSANSTSNFYSGALVVARRFGSNSLGLELESLKGTGSLASTTTDSDDGPTPSIERIDATSTVNQTRLTAGYARDLAHQAKLGIFYRYAFIAADDRDVSHTIDGVAIGLNSTRTSGHSFEAGIRLRGTITPRLYYGFTAAWLGVSMRDSLTRIDAADSQERDRAQRGSIALGFGYALNRRATLSFDLAGGANRAWAARTENTTGNLLQNGDANGHFVSMHGAAQVDMTRRLFVSASLLNIWQRHDLSVALFPDRLGVISPVQDSFFPTDPAMYQTANRFSDFGAGWRFSRSLFAQYVVSTDFGVSSPTHILMVRYTFRLGRE